MEDRQNLLLNNRPLTPLTVEGFLRAAAEPLGLGLVAGASGLGRAVAEPVLHRSGLALTGFLDHFAFRRPQLIGQSETAYLLALEPGVRLRRWEALLRMEVPCVILCAADGRAVGGELLRLAGAVGVPVLCPGRSALDVFRIGAQLLHDLTSPIVSLHGTLMEVRGVGVLLRGPAGIGKSETALGLLRRGHTLIADDQPHLTLDGHGGLRGYAPGHMRGYLDIRGLGMLSVNHLFGVLAVREACPLDLIVNLCLCSDEVAHNGVAYEQGELRGRIYEILGVSVPGYDIPVAAGRDFVNVVETAAAVYRLRRLGIDPAALLDSQIIAHNQTVRQDHHE